MFFVFIALFACTDGKQEVVLPLKISPKPTQTTEAAPPEQSAPIDLAPDNPSPLPFSDGCQATSVWQEMAPQPEVGVTVTSSAETSRIIAELLVDFLLSDGEVVYSVKCPSNAISVDVPSNLGTVRLAVFVDSDRNGPSKSDLQGVSQPISITTTAVTVPPISLSKTPVPLFNFGEE